MTSERIALFMCAAHCQGFHSSAGRRASEVLGVTFPIRMDSLALKAISEGLNPEELWPWFVVSSAYREDSE